VDLEIKEHLVTHLPTSTPDWTRKLRWDMTGLLGMNTQNTGREGNSSSLLHAKQGANRVSSPSQVTMTLRHKRVRSQVQHTEKMAPLRVGGSFAATRKQSKQPVDEEVEEVVGPSAPMPPEIFHRDYFPPWKDDVHPRLQYQVNAKYPLPIAPVPKGVSQDKDMLDKVANLKFMDHDITDMQKFPELAGINIYAQRPTLVQEKLGWKHRNGCWAWRKLGYSSCSKFHISDEVTKSMPVSRYFSVASMGGHFG
jgi:hypothetical protein